jgi:hypothetical protein
MQEQALGGALRAGTGNMAQAIDYGMPAVRKMFGGSGGYSGGGSDLDMAAGVINSGAGVPGYNPAEYLPPNDDFNGVKYGGPMGGYGKVGGY